MRAEPWLFEVPPTTDARAEEFRLREALVPALDAMQLIERGFVAASSTGLTNAGGRSYVRTRNIAGTVNQLAQRV